MRISGKLAMVGVLVFLVMVAVAAVFWGFWGGPAAGVEPSDALGAASLLLTAVIFAAGCALALAGVRAYKHSDELAKRLEEAQAALSALKQQTRDAERETEHLRHLVKQMEPVVWSQARREAREELPTCGPERAGVLLRNLFGCLDLLDASDLEYIEPVKQRFSKHEDIVVYCDRLIAAIREREEGGGTEGVAT